LGKSKQINTAQLVGKDRQTVIWANAVMQFFLALARHENEPELEKLLYQLFMILPAEASNSKTRFMEKRLWFSELSKSTKLKMNTFGNRQDLIQFIVYFNPLQTVAVTTKELSRDTPYTS